jgi:hypothetical protein
LYAHLARAVDDAGDQAVVRAGLISSNPGRWPELAAAARPRSQVWTRGPRTPCRGLGHRRPWRLAERDELGPGAGLAVDVEGASELGEGAKDDPMEHSLTPTDPPNDRGVSSVGTRV